MHGGRGDKLGRVLTTRDSSGYCVCPQSNAGKNALRFVGP